VFKFAIVSASLLGLMIAAPAEAGRKKDSELEAALDRLAAMPVTCTGEQDCAKKWAKAMIWVSENSVFKIQLANDMMIQTYGPSTVIHGTAFTIIKIPTAGGHAFDFRATCLSQPFCGQSVRDYKSSFAATVMGPDPVAQE